MRRIILFVIGLHLFAQAQAQSRPVVKSPVNVTPAKSKPTPVTWILGQYIGDYYEYSKKERRLIDKGYQFFNTVALAQGSNKLYGLVDQDEKWAASPVYEEIKIPEYYHFPAKLKGKWGLIDKCGEIVIAFKYDDFYYLTGDAPDQMIAAKLNRKWGVIDKWGKNVVIPFIYDDLGGTMEEEAGGRISHFPAKFKGKWGYIDMDDPEHTFHEDKSFEPDDEEDQ